MVKTKTKESNLGEFSFYLQYNLSDKRLQKRSTVPQKPISRELYFVPELIDEGPEITPSLSFPYPTCLRIFITNNKNN